MKPNYMRILMKSCKEFVVVVKRLLKHEEMDLIDVKYIDHGRIFLVALVGSDRLIMVQHPKGTKKAHMKEFDRALWDQHGADAIDLLKHTDAGEVWRV